MTDAFQHNLGIDFGEENIGVALVRWDDERNHVLYTSIPIIRAKLLKELFTYPFELFETLYGVSHTELFS